MVSQAEVISKDYYSLVPGIISIFLKTVLVPLTYIEEHNIIMYTSGYL